MTVLDTTPFTSGFAYGASGGFLAGHGQYNLQVGQPGHAFVWDARTVARRDLHPQGFALSRAYNTDGRMVVGEVVEKPVSNNHAFVWDLKTGTGVNLHPKTAPTANSIAVAADGGQQVGHLYEGVPGARPALWTGTAESFIDLMPPGATSGSARGVDAGRQVGGHGGPITGNQGHAIMWFGSATNYVDLHPPLYTSTVANAIEGDVVVGEWTIPGNHRPRALRWNLTTGSVTDLHFGPELARTHTLDTNGELTVGYSVWDGLHAIVWYGSGSQFVDLNEFLPAGIDGAEANGVDENGFIVGTGYSNAGGYSVALLWSPVPEPATLIACSGLLAIFFFRYRRK